MYEVKVYEHGMLLAACTRKFASKSAAMRLADAWSNKEFGYNAEVVNSSGDMVYMTTNSGNTITFHRASDKEY